MAGTRTLSVVIAGDSTSARRAFGEAETAASAMQKRLEDVGRKMQDVGRTMTLGVTLPIVAGMAASVMAASNLQETINKADVVFGENAASIKKWAEGGARDFGLSQRAALDAASTFGNMFDQLEFGATPTANMSKRLTELAADLASFHNADITEVILAQQAAFRGEYDSIQRFIPTINAAAVEMKALEITGKATTDELTAQDKALAAYKLIMEGAGQAVGDFDRTNDSMANQLRIARAEIENAGAEIGAVLLPMVAAAAGAVADLAHWFAGLPEPVQTAVVAFGGLLAVVGPVVYVAGSLIRNLQTIQDGLGSLGTALGSSGVALGAWGLAIGLAAGTVYGLSQALSGNTGTLDVNVQAIMRLSDAQLANAATTLIAKLGMDGFAETVKRVAAESTTTARALVEAADLNAAARERLLASIDREEQASSRAAQRSREDAEAKQRLAEAAGAAEARIRGLTAAHNASIASAVAAGYAGPEAYAEGGWVHGSGSGDTVPAMLTPGEFVLSKDMLAGRASVPSGVGVSSGGAPSVVVNVHGSVITERQLDEVVATSLARWQRHNGN